MFSSAMPWPEEVGRIFFVLCTYSSMVYVMRRNGHLRLGFVQSFFPASQKCLELFQLVCTCAYFAFSFYLLWLVLKKVVRIGANFVTIPLPMWTIWAAIMAFCFLISATALVMFMKVMQDKNIDEMEN